jgi:hypothetical protein
VVNIAAVMAALDNWDLDHSAKHALVVVGCRANRHTGRAPVAIKRVAADMKVDYDTARRALNRVVEAGYLTVEKSVGRRSVWCLNLAAEPRPHPAAEPRGTSRIDDPDLAAEPRPPRGSDACAKESCKEKTKEWHNGARPAARKAPAGTAVDGSSSPVPPDPSSNTTYAHFPDWTGTATTRVVLLPPEQQP